MIPETILSQDSKASSNAMNKVQRLDGSGGCTSPKV